MADLVIQRMNTEMDWLERGLELADIPQDQGGWQEYFSESDAGDLRIEDEHLRASCAIILENAKQNLARSLGAHRRRSADGVIRIDETVRSSLVGGYSDYLFPVLRASFVSNAVTELVSVQPTTRRISTIMMWNYVFGTTKGGITKGQRAYDATAGRQDSGHEYTSEKVSAETVANAARSNSNLTLSGTLAYASGGGVRPGTVSLTTTTDGATRLYYDDSNGAFRTPSGVTIGSSSINYQTGAWSITITTVTFDSATVVASYEWDSEGSCDIPEMDISITTTTANTVRRAIKLTYTTEAMQDMLAEMGTAIEPHLISLGAEELNYEIARQIVSEIWALAPVIGTFNLTPPGSNYYPQQDHFRDFIYLLNKAANSIWERTQKAYANWIVVDANAATFIESLPANMFEPAPQPENPQGLHYIGTLNKRFRVYKDMLLRNEAGASAYGNILMGYKGNDFWKAGYIWSPYQMLYSTDTDSTACFTHSKGLATRYATKVVNAQMFARISLGA